jgi:hypothetical protein
MGGAMITRWKSLSALSPEMMAAIHQNAVRARTAHARQDKAPPVKNMPRAVCAETEARLRAQVGDEAFDAVPDAKPRRQPRRLGQRKGRNGASAGPRPKREKVFGEGRAVPLDGNVKARITTLARALMRPTEKGKHWGPITAKFFEVLKALLWAFHNAKSGRCFPSYETIAKKADCGEDTVARAIVALEQVGILGWCNRLARVTVDGVTKVVRTSNAYWFNDPRSKSEFKSGTRFAVNQTRFAVNQRAKKDRTDGASRAESISRKEECPEEVT